ncbi:hypothetical protein [Actinophytocola sp. KF-1]
MLGPTDQGHFLKYLTTLGVAIVVASLGLGGYLLQTQSDLLIKREELAKLTPAAREAIEHKQQVVLMATTIAPFVLGAMVVVGVAMAIAGLTGWSKKQRLLDERDVVEVAKMRRELELMQMTDEEKRETLAVEAEELVEDEAAEAAAQHGSVSVRDDEPVDGPEPEVPPDSGTGSLAGERDVPRDPATARRRVTHAIEVLNAKLREAYPGATILQDLKSGPFSVDALVMLPKERQLLAFDLRITTSRNFTNRLVDATATLSAAVEAAERQYDSYQRIPVFVVLVRDPIEFTRMDWRKRVRQVAAAARHRPVVLMYDELEWEGLPAGVLQHDIVSEYRRAGRVRTA